MIFERAALVAELDSSSDDNSVVLGTDSAVVVVTGRRTVLGGLVDLVVPLVDVVAEPVVEEELDFEVVVDVPPDAPPDAPPDVLPAGVEVVDEVELEPLDVDTVVEAGEELDVVEVEATASATSTEVPSAPRPTRDVGVLAEAVAIRTPPASPTSTTSSDSSNVRSANENRCTDKDTYLPTTALHRVRPQRQHRHARPRLSVTSL